MERTLILSKEKYLISNNVYDNFVSVHKSLNLLEPTPQNWEGLTVDDAIKYLGIGDKGIKIKSPIDEIIIYKSHLEHLINDNDKHRKKHLNRAIRTIQAPNLIIKTNAYNNYVKLFVDDKSNIKPHLQIVKVKTDGSFYVTNFQLTKKQFKTKILEGEIIYDLSSVPSR
jgi:hypothetical protein